LNEKSQSDCFGFFVSVERELPAGGVLQWEQFWINWPVLDHGTIEQFQGEFILVVVSGSTAAFKD
jgi:hypothetical protein